MSWYDYLNPLYDIKQLGNSATNTGSTQASQAAGTNAIGLQHTFMNLGSAFGNTNMPTSNADLATNNTNQNANIGMLQKYAAGQMPSAAELQLRNQEATNAANAYGTAAAVGSRTPGAAMDAAMRAAQQSQTATNQQAAVQRAQEQAQAQGQLAAALNAQANTQAALRGQNLNYMQGMYGNALGASGQNVTAAGQQTTANLQNAQMQNQFLGGLTGGAASAFGSGGSGGSGAATSDEREKKNVTQIGSTAFDRLADALKGFSFEYKHPGDVPGESPGPRVSVMAQDAARGGMPVAKGADGVMRLDRDNMLGTALAMSAEALRRTKGKTEGRLAGALRKAA